MNDTPTLAPPAKDERNPHETSGDESPSVASHEQQTRGGGYRSGSRGAGTSERSDDEGAHSPTPGKREVTLLDHPTFESR